MMKVALKIDLDNKTVRVMYSGVESIVLVPLSVEAVQGVQGVQDEPLVEFEPKEVVEIETPKPC
jgi:hypothetical protein